MSPPAWPGHSGSTSSKSAEATSAEAKSAEASSDAGKLIDAKAKTSLPAAGGMAAAKAEAAVSRTALDRPGMERPKDRAAEKTDDLLIVPEGTQVEIDISEGKVVVPVRVGFATAIPALSKATVRVYLQGTGDSV